MLLRGSVAERPNALALKARDLRGSGGSNPSASALGRSWRRNSECVAVSLNLPPQRPTDGPTSPASSFPGYKPDTGGGPGHDEARVNPSMLRELVSVLDTAAASVREMNPDPLLTATVTDLTCSDTARACIDLAADLGLRLDAILRSIDRLSSGAKGGADTFELAEADVAASLKSIYGGK